MTIQKQLIDMLPPSTMNVKQIHSNILWKYDNDTAWVMGYNQCLEEITSILSKVRVDEGKLEEMSDDYWEIEAFDNIGFIKAISNADILKVSNGDQV